MHRLKFDEYLQKLHDHFAANIYACNMKKYISKKTELSIAHTSGVPNTPKVRKVLLHSSISLGDN